MYILKEDTNKQLPLIVDTETGEVITPKFDHYVCPWDYIKNGVRFLEPMTAKEYLNDEELELMLTSNDYIVEEKLDGTRCTMHLGKSNRLFSRRISKKTDWFAENTDSVPHLRDLETPIDFYDTVLDGEMRIEGKEFKEVSSTLNCKWNEAITRQIDIGFITLHAFDIIYYKGVYVAKLPLIKRKQLLKEVVQALDSKYVCEEKYTDDIIFVPITPTLKDSIINDETHFMNTYPELYGVLDFLIEPKSELFKGVHKEVALTKKAWYEYIVLHGGEGIMLKHKMGTYKHSRGREYTKYKKFNTWDVVILDYIPPTKEYTGKELNSWTYWYDESRDTKHLLVDDNPHKANCTPVTKHFFYDWIGTIKYGVLITDEELIKWKKANPKEKAEVINNYLVVGEASGFDEDTRKYITNNQDSLKYSVIEVGANDILKTGKLRHPRFMRFRSDKNAEQCIWKDHIR